MNRILVLALSSSVVVSASSRPMLFETTTEAQNARSEQRGTQAAPLVVSLDSAQRSAEARLRDQEQRDSKDDAATLNRYTLALAVVAGFQFIAFIYQGMKLRDSVDAMGRQEALMLRSIEATEASAAATAKAARAAEAQAAAANLQSDLTAKTVQEMKMQRQEMKEQVIAINRSVEVANEQLAAMQLQGKYLEREFLATHRPELIIRSVVVSDDPEAIPGVDRWFYLVTFYVVNHGRSDATIVAMDTVAKFWKPDEPLGYNPLLSQPPTEVPPEAVRPGASTLRLMRGETHYMAKGIIELGYDKASEFFVFGRLVYLDSAGTRRELGFCRRHDLKSGRTTDVNEPDFNYSD